MSKVINGTAFNKALKTEKLRVYIARRDWGGRDYFFYFTDRFMLGVPVSSIDELGDYLKSMLLTPEGNRLKAGEGQKFDHGSDTPRLLEPRMVEEMLAILTKASDGRELNPTPYFLAGGSGTLAIYETEGTPVVLDIVYLDILPLTSSGKCEPTKGHAFFKGPSGIVFFLCAVEMGEARNTELSALVTEFVKNYKEEIKNVSE